jgi:hypothetical protein
MTFKRALCASALAAGIGIAGPLLAGLGTASADPWQRCDRPGAWECDRHDDRGPGPADWNNRGSGPADWNNRGPGPADWNNRGSGPADWNDRGPGPADWNNRGIDQARWDHQPFNWNGWQANPIPAGDGNGWGFWFLGQWIPL